MPPYTRSSSEGVLVCGVGGVATKMHEGAETERGLLQQLDGIRPLVERRVARLPREQRRDAVIAVVSEVYLKLQSSGGVEDIHTLAIREMRLIERCEKRDARHRAVSYNVEWCAIDPAVDAARNYRSLVVP